MPPFWFNRGQASNERPMPSALGRGRRQKKMCLLWQILALSQVQGPKTAGRFSTVGLQGSCNMEVLVGIDANDDVVLLSQSWLCQCCFCHRSLTVVGKSDQHGSRTGRQKRGSLPMGFLICGLVQPPAPPQRRQVCDASTAPLC